MKVTKLSNIQLNYWVAKAQGWLFCSPDGWDSWCDVTGMILHDIPEYHPSTNWQQCGELIEKFKVFVHPSEDGWLSTTQNLMDAGIDPDITESDPKRAACMAVIADKFGEEVEE